MAKESGRRLRDLPPEVRREVNKARAQKLTAQVKAEEAKAEAEKHQDTIDRLTGKKDE